MDHRGHGAGCLEDLQQREGSWSQRPRAQQVQASARSPAHTGCLSGKGGRMNSKTHATGRSIAYVRYYQPDQRHVGFQTQETPHSVLLNG